jgi:cyclophilin family peptidyl-prolyl cis-trans isomerase
VSETRFLTALAFLGLGAAFIGCGNAVPSPAAAVGEGETRFDVPAPLPVSMEQDVTERVEIKTSMGSIVVGLYGDAAPDTVKSFLSYVDRGFYSGKIFHRVIPGFMIQGGGFDAALERAETDPPLRLEIIPGLKHEAGIISMARTSDPNSATSQFFICVSAATQLNGGYAAFGHVEEGLTVALEISSVPTQTVTGERGEMNDVPTQPVVIEHVRRLGLESAPQGDAGP